MTTLIVRDATLAVNGAPETRGDAGEHLLERIAEVEKMDSATADACIEVLAAAADGKDDVDVEVLLALTILGFGQPDSAARQGVTPLGYGRRLAACKEREGDPDSALALIEKLRELSPAHGALERDYESTLRRMGMVHDLAQRYFRRAQFLLQEGKKEEAVGWLREVLLLDKSRKDVARMIRDLRLEKDQVGKRPLTVSPGLVLVLLVPLALTALVMREKSLRERYLELPPAAQGDLTSMRERLGAVETFLSDHRVWHGSLMVLSERSDLRIEIDKLELNEERRREADLRSEIDRRETVELLRERGRMAVNRGDYESALADFQEALELAPPDWEHRERVSRDVAAIIDYLAAEEPPSASPPGEESAGPETEDAR
jgi:tetratricopeptide (TPR) repeat protein